MDGSTRECRSPTTPRTSTWPGRWIDTTAAVVLAAAPVLLLGKDALNWRQGVTDEFAQNSLGLKLGTVFEPPYIVGPALATAGLISGL